MQDFLVKRGKVNAEQACGTYLCQLSASGTLLRHVVPSTGASAQACQGHRRSASMLASASTGLDAVVGWPAR